MPTMIENNLLDYIQKIKNIYGSHLKKVILYGSYARGDFNSDSDIDIMILLDLTDMEIKEYRHQLSDMTYDYNMDYNMDIRPIVKNDTHFYRWTKNYPFYGNVVREGVILYD